MHTKVWLGIYWKALNCTTLKSDKRILRWILGRGFEDLRWIELAQDHAPRQTLVFVKISCSITAVSDL